MADVCISRLNQNEQRRFASADHKCCYCGERITSLPISVRYKLGRSSIYNFYHIGCFILNHPSGHVTNAKGLDLLFDKGV